MTITSQLVTPPGFEPRKIHSPSALSAHRECHSMWGRTYLLGRREPEVRFDDLPAPPPKPPKGASAVEKAKRKQALKAYNKQMRPALGKATHAIYEAYYLQKCGKWHAPMAWLDLDVAWNTRPGQVALSGRAHLPDPSSLADVWVEELVRVEAVPGWDVAIDGAFPPMGGTPDLVALTKTTWRVEPRGLGGGYDEIEEVEIPGRFHLYDHKTTVDFEWAKTEAELLEDEQANLYGLAVMQMHGLDSLECTWVYYRTNPDLPPASHAVHFTLTRAHAEAVVLRMAKQAAELEAIQQRFLAESRGMLGRRLQIVKELDTNDIACDNFGGCLHHVKRGGDCKPRKSSLGEALRKQSAKTKKLTARRDAAKAAKLSNPTTSNKRAINTMALSDAQAARLAELEAMPAEGDGKRNFAQNQELKNLKKQAGGTEASGGAAEKPPVETTGAEVAETPAAKPAAAAPAATKPKGPAAKPADLGDGIFAIVAGFKFEVPPTTVVGKLLVKAARAVQAAAAAFEGE